MYIPLFTKNLLTIVYDDVFTHHLTGKEHPESPDRVLVVKNALEQAGLMNSDNTVRPHKATDEDILRCHSIEWLQQVKDSVERIGYHQVQTLNEDTCFSKESLDVALYAAGAGITAVDIVMENPGTKVFCLIRPPGHHAESHEGGGFCLFNNAAIAARYAQVAHKINRVAIVDWDVHHGNGTQEIFYSDPTVFYFSTHRKDGRFYPMTGDISERGSGAGLGFNRNCSFSDDRRNHSKKVIMEAFRNTFRNDMEKFKPDLVIISAGFDAHEDDLFKAASLNNHDFYELTCIVNEVANRYAEGRVISFLEGGYSLQVLAAACTEHVKALKGIAYETESDDEDTIYIELD